MVTNLKIFGLFLVLTLRRRGVAWGKVSRLDLQGLGFSRLISDALRRVQRAQGSVSRAAATAQREAGFASGRAARSIVHRLERFHENTRARSTGEMADR